MVYEFAGMGRAGSLKQLQVWQVAFGMVMVLGTWACGRHELISGMAFGALLMATQGAMLQRQITQKNLTTSAVLLVLKLAVLLAALTFALMRLHLAPLGVFIGMCSMPLGYVVGALVGSSNGAQA